jgi:trehalose/maltose hydrolase-like predicted phosphorylase
VRRGIAYRLFGAYSDKTWADNMETSVTADLTGEKLYLLTSFVPGVMHSEPHQQAQRLLELANWTGLDRVREDNRRAWAKLWESRITIEGASEEWQDAIDASYFYLMSSVSEFSPASVPPYGYSNVDAYGGHAFWDTESFMFLPPLFCAPEAARSMLEYRFQRREAAAANARLNGYRGIQFPWQSGATGCEVTPPWAKQAGEQHINLDVALAFDGFARVHGDEIFIRERAWPILKGVCEWIESRVVKTDRGYEIHHITGIDEEHDDVNNDSYSNLMAAKLLRSGCEYAEMLGYRKPAKWMAIADNLFVPVKDGVLQQYEGMPDVDNMPVTAVMSYFPYGHTDTPENDRKTWQYYIDHGMEAYCRYPMLSGFLGVFPAWLGDRELALRYYEVSNLNFFVKPFHSVVEWGLDPAERDNVQRPLATSFITGRGSFLTGLIMGLTKFCPWKGAVDAPVEDWLGEDIVLPAGWSKITVGRVTIRGKDYRIEAEHGAKRAKLIEIE